MAMNQDTGQCIFSNLKATIMHGSKTIHEKIVTDTKQLFDPGEAYGLLWEDSDNVTHCRDCNAEFKIPFLLKHHCRRCAGVYCESCCKFDDIKKEANASSGAPKKICSGCRFGETPGEPIMRLIRKQLEKALNNCNDNRNEALKAIDKKLKKVVSKVGENFGTKKTTTLRPPSSRIELKRGSLCDESAFSKVASIPGSGYFEFMNKTDRFCCIKVLLPGGDRKFEVPRPSYTVVPPSKAVHGSFDDEIDDLEMVLLYDNPNNPDTNKRVVYETRGAAKGGKPVAPSPCASVGEFQSVAFFTFPSAGSNVIVKYKGDERVEPRKGNAIRRIGLLNRLQGKRFGENMIDLATNINAASLKFTLSTA